MQNATPRGEVSATHGVEAITEHLASMHHLEIVLQVCGAHGFAFPSIAKYPIAIEMARLEEIPQVSDVWAPTLHA